MKKIIFLLTILLFSQISFAQKDSSYEMSVFEKKAMQWAYNIHYVDNTTDPNSKITRAEFIKLVTSYKYNEEEIKNCDLTSIDFLDFKKSDFYAPYICIAYKNDLINGYLDKTIKPNKKISIVEAIKVFSIVGGININQPSINWYDRYLYAFNITFGYPKTFTIPTRAITKIEVIEILYLVANNLKNETSIYYDFYDNTFKKKYLVVDFLNLGNKDKDLQHFNSHYAITKDNTLIYISKDLRGGHVFKKIENIVDSESFYIIDEITAKDKNNIYVDGEIYNE